MIPEDRIGREESAGCPPDALFLDRGEHRLPLEDAAGSSAADARALKDELTRTRADSVVLVQGVSIPFLQLDYARVEKEDRGPTDLAATDVPDRVKDILKNFEPPKMDAGRAEALASFVSRRTAEGVSPLAGRFWLFGKRELGAVGKWET